MAQTDEALEETVLHSIPRAIRYPLVGVLPFLILALVVFVCWLLYMYLGVILLFLWSPIPRYVILGGIAYWILYATGKALWNA